MECESVDRFSDLRFESRLLSHEKRAIAMIALFSWLTTVYEVRTAIQESLEDGSRNFDNLSSEARL